MPAKKTIKTKSKNFTKKGGKPYFGGDALPIKVEISDGKNKA